MPDGSVPGRSEQGKEILTYAFNSDFCILEFTELDDGTTHVTDITEHVRQLEKMHLNNDPAQPIDVRTDAGQE